MGIELALTYNRLGAIELLEETGFRLGMLWRPMILAVSLAQRPPRQRLSPNAHGASDPPVAVNPHQVATLRAAGASWQTISRELGIGVGTACRALQSRSKNLPESCAVNA
jgi:hypothetical protein